MPGCEEPRVARAGGPYDLLSCGRVDHLASTKGESKHEGLSMIFVPTDNPQMEIKPIDTLAAARAVSRLAGGRARGSDIAWQRMGSETHRPEGVSLIVTVRNDREGLRELIGALAEQSEMPDEIVVVDGGSDDGTLSELDCWDRSLAPVHVVVSPGANIAAGRNIAVREARHEWLVCTDAGCRPVPGWLSALRRARAAGGEIVAGVFIVDGESDFDQALACAHYPVLDELHDTSAAIRIAHRLFGRDFRAQHAGGRSMAFSRSAWEAAGGFPEHVHAGEDLAFSAAAIERGYPAVLAEDAIVRWYPRSTWRENARMFATYTRGDIRTKGRFRHLARFFAWAGGVALLVSGGLRGRLLALAGAAAYLWLPFRRARLRGLPLRSWWRIPALVALKDLSQLAGAVVGIVDAARGQPQPRPRERRAGQEDSR